MLENVLTVEGLMQKEYLYLHPQDSIGKVFSIFGETTQRTILVLDDTSRCLGSVTFANVLKNLSSLQTQAQSLMSPVPEIDLSETDFIETAKHIINSNISAIPIVDKYSKVKGIITDFQLADILLDISNLYSMPVNDFIHALPIHLTVNDSLGALIAHLRKTNFAQIAVLEEGKLRAVVKTRSLVKSNLINPGKQTPTGDAERATGTVTISNLIEDPVILDLQKNPTFMEVFDLMELKNSPVIFFVDGSNELVGALSVRNILRFLIQEAQEKISYAITVMDAPDEDVEEAAIEKAKRLLDKYHDTLGEGECYIRFKKIIYQSKRGYFSYNCQLKVNFSRRQVYSVEVTEFGSGKALQEAFQKIKRIIDSRRRQKIARNQAEVRLKDYQDYRPEF